MGYPNISAVGNVGIISILKVIVSEVVREGGKMECSMVSADEDKETVFNFS